MSYGRIFERDIKGEMRVSFHDQVTLCHTSMLNFELLEVKEQILVGFHNKQIVLSLVATRAGNLDDLLREIVEFDIITTKFQYVYFSFGQKY